MKRKTDKKLEKWWIWWIIKAFSIKFIFSYEVAYSLIYTISFPSDCIRFKYVNDLRKFLKMAFQIHLIHPFGAF